MSICSAALIRRGRITDQYRRRVTGQAVLDPVLRLPRGPLLTLAPGGQVPPSGWRKTSAPVCISFVLLGSEDGGGVVTLRGEACSDGMSDMAFGIRADVFLQATALAEGRALQGCCTLVP